MALPALKLEDAPDNPGNPNLGDLSADALSIKQGIRRTLRQAVNLQELAYNAALELKLKPGETEPPDQARARAMAIASVVKAWETAVDRVRIWRGKPLPSNPRNAQPKPSKQVAFNPFKEQ